MLPDAPKFSGTWIVQYQHSVGTDSACTRKPTTITRVRSTPTWRTPRPSEGGIPSVCESASKIRPSIGTGVWATNLTDTRPLTYAYAGSQGQQVSYYQKPRSVGVNFTYNF